MSKRIGLIALLAMVLVLAVASGVLAAQNADSGSYEATPKVFNGDGATQYPNEIYLPNETSPDQYRIHSNYNSTTDACASCHATHTGVGEALLQWGSVYDTCMACHDGTVTTTYDVSHGEIGSTNARTSAGVFSGAASASNHNVTGAMSIYAAPGGPGTAGVDPTPVLNSKGVQVNWDVEFGCQSCHSPHGQGGNARLLNPDVNGYAWANKQTGRALNSVDATTYTSDFNGDGVADTWIQGYPYTSKVYVGGVQDTTVTINNEAGYTKVIFAAAPAGAVTADFFPALVVKMNVANYLAADETVTHVSGLNSFCGACHADYNTAAVTSPGSNLNGTYTEAYRHKVGFARTKSAAQQLGTLNMKLEGGTDTAGGNVTCETCHLAHGTDSQYWKDTLTLADADLVEIAGSSALKRLPNMGTCEACHAKAKGNQGYAVVAASAGNGNPSNQGDAAYVGSAACQSCHEERYAGWQDTLHSKMIGQGAGTVLTAAKVDDNTWKGSASLVRNQDSTAFAPKDVILTIGTKWKQRYIVPSTTGVGQYAFLSKQYNVTSGAFEAYTNKADYDLYCLACHSTGYKVTAQDEVTKQDKAATWKEVSIGCEACHGPGSKHQAAPNAYNIWNPAKQSAADVSKACGYCHTRGESEEHLTLAGDGTATLIGREDYPAEVGQTHEPWEDWADFSKYGAVIPGIVGPGDKVTNRWDYADYSSALLTANQGPITGLRDMFYKPNGDGLFDDKKHHQEYQSFAQTGAGHNTTFSCTSCHSSHSRNAEKEPLKQLGADLCASCHGTTYSIANNMPMTGKTVNNVYVRTHSFSAVPTPQPAGALNPVNP